MALENESSLKNDYQIFFILFSLYIMLAMVLGAIASKIDYESAFSRWAGAKSAGRSMSYIHDDQ
jgi:hypothetical protein